MNKDLPLVERETETLELQSRAVLAEPAKVARGVVAMLNTRGGRVWIGVEEAIGQNQVQAIADAESERTRLQDSLLDLIEPSLLPDEVTVTVEGVEPGCRVLLVSVQPRPARGPFALLGRRGGRTFVRRFDNRTVAMTYDEIRLGFRSGTADAGEIRHLLRFQEERESLLHNRQARFSLLLEPDRPGQLILPKVIDDGLLTDPTRTGTPRSSYNYTAAAQCGPPRRESVRHGFLQMGDEALGVRCEESGAVHFAADLRSFVMEGSGLVRTEALLGYTISIFRLVCGLLERDRLWRKQSEGPFWASLLMTRLEGGILLPGILSKPLEMYDLERFRYRDQDLLIEPRPFSQEALRKRPDDCARGLLRRVYREFGHVRDGDIPSNQSVGLG